MSTRRLALVALPLLALVTATASAAEIKLSLSKSGRRTAARLQPADGGEIVSADKQIRVQVPPAAIAKATRVTVQELVGHTDPRIVTKTYEVGPHGASFAKPVELCFTLAPTEDAKPDALAGTCLGYYDDGSKQWKCEDECLERKGDLVCGETSHFTNFALLLTGRSPNSKCDDVHYLQWSSDAQATKG